MTGPGSRPQPGPDDEATILRSRLVQTARQLSAAPELRGPLGRLLAEGETPALLAALTGEIAATILPRRLWLRTGRGAEFFCEVYGGRLLLLEPAPGVVMPAGDAGAEQLLAVLTALLPGPDQLWSIGTAATADRSGGLVGIAATELALQPAAPPEPEPEPGPPATPPDPGRPAVERLAPLMEAALGWLQIIGTDEQARGGKRHAFKALREVARTRLERLRAANAGSDGQCILFGPEGEQLLAIALDGDSALLLLLPAGMSGRVLELWDHPG